MSINEIINREISWLSFNHRVLQEAEDPNVPLIERVRFLGIFSNNLDEFFKVRVATIKRMIDLHVQPVKTTGDKPSKILRQIHEIVMDLQEEFGETYAKILQELERENIYILNENDLDEQKGKFVKEYFNNNVMPTLSTILLNNILPPILKDKTIYLATKLTNTKTGDVQYALIEVPRKAVSRFVILPPENNKKFIILVDDVVRYCLCEIFSMFDFDLFEAYTIKLTRDAELDIDNDLSKSFLEKISKGVAGREKGHPTRFIYDSSIPDDLLKYITNKMNFTKYDNLIPGGRYHNFSDFMDFPNMGRPDLEHKKINPITHKLFKGQSSLLSVIEKKDILLHYPYYNFGQYIYLLREASIDPNVVSIKTTIYRTAKHSKVINALINAAKNNKQVTVNIELRARFDEGANIHWSKKLQDAGAKVLFGIDGLKVHSKLVLITKKINNEYKQYGGVGTGNFHEGTARVYSDFLLLTIDKRITREIDRVFEYFENTYQNFAFKYLLVSPLNQRRRIMKLIDNEIVNALTNKPAYIIFKLNSLVDKEIINKLYQANEAGVKIFLIVRGICSLIPGVPGMSENIQAVSIVDKFLEHTRIFVFCNNNDEYYYLSSADIMPRNLDHRVEVSAPVFDPDLQKEIQDFLAIQLNDNVKARIIDEQQKNQYKIDGKKENIRSQTTLYDYYKRKEEDKGKNKFYIC